jgi:O-antigen/teichoic acid export membrane protein
MKRKIINLLRWLQKYTKTDMVYVVKGGFWLTVANVGISAISFINMMVFARWLSKEGYGVYQFVINSLALFSIFTIPGINTSVIKSVAQKKEGTLQLAVKEKIKWGLLGSLLALVLTGWYFGQDNKVLATAFLLGALFVPFKETFRIFTSFWTGRKRFDIQTKYDLVSNALSALFLVSAIYLTNNVLVIIFVFLLSYTFFNWIFYRKTVQQIVNKEEDKEAISFGKNLTLIYALEITAFYLDRIIIWKFLGAVPVAIYTFAKQPIEKIKDALPIASLALPKFGENKIDGQRKKGIMTKFLQLFAVSVPTAAVLALTAPFLYSLFFPQYMESVVYFQALSGIIAIFPFLIFNTALIAEMKKGALYVVNGGVPFLKIVLFLALIPHFGIWGIIIAILTTEVLKGLLGFYYFLKI